jgi:ABC-type uncharacterized transport system permease subunit
MRDSVVADSFVLPRLNDIVGQGNHQLLIAAKRKMIKELEVFSVPRALCPGSMQLWATLWSVQ